MRLDVACALLGLLLGACQAQAPDHEPTTMDASVGELEACKPELLDECPTPAVVYADVAPIFDEHCASCHTGALGKPWSLADYGHVADWADEVRGQVLNCTMPPADAGSTITNAERTKILGWIMCGALP